MDYDVMSMIGISAALISFTILFPLADSMKIKWSQERERQAALPASQRNYEKAIKLSNNWHTVGFWLRTFILVGFFFAGGIVWGIIGLMLLSFGHNIIIQIGLGQPWYKVGTTAKTDIFLRKVWAWIVTQYKKIDAYFKK